MNYVRNPRIALAAVVMAVVACSSEQRAPSAESAAAVREADFNRSKYGDSAAYSRDSAAADSILKAVGPELRP